MSERLCEICDTELASDEAELCLMCEQTEDDAEDDAEDEETDAELETCSQCGGHFEDWELGPEGMCDSCVEEQDEEDFYTLDDEDEA